MNEQQFRELSAARALHALSPEEEESFSRALAAHPEWQSVVDEDMETAAQLAATSPEVAPPAAAKAAIFDLIAHTPQFAASTPGGADDGAHDGAQGSVDDGAHDDVHGSTPGAAVSSGGTRGLRRRAGWFALAASVAVLIAVSVAVPWSDIFAEKDPALVALQEVESQADAGSAGAEFPHGGSATLHWSSASRQAVFVAEDLPQPPTGRDYELWVVRGDTPISVGVVRVDDAGAAAVLAPEFTPGDAVAVTVEQRGGSPSGAPTSDPIFVVSTA